MLFCDFLQFDRLRGRGQESYFLATNRGAKTIFNSKHNQLRNRKIHAIDTKDSKIQWIYFNGFSTKPKKTNVNIEKTLANATCFDKLFQMLIPIISSMSVLWNDPENK